MFRVSIFISLKKTRFFDSTLDSSITCIPFVATNDPHNKTLFEIGLFGDVPPKVFSHYGAFFTINHGR